MGWGNRTGLALLAIAIAAAPHALPGWYYNLIHVGMYTLICIGLSLLLGYAGQISLGHAAFFGIGAYVSGILTTRFGWSPWVAVWAGVALSALVALAVGLPSLRLHGHYLAMATLAFGEIVHVVSKAWVSMTGGPSGFGRIPVFEIAGTRLISPKRDDLIFYLVWGVAYLGLVAALGLIHSRTGRALRAIHDGEQAAAVLGVPTARLKVRIFVLSAVYASIAGSLYAHVMTFVNPSPFTIEHSVLFIVMVIVGGMRSVWGAVLGAVLMGLLPEWLSHLEEWRFVIYGAVVLFVMMFMPQGVLLGARDGALRLWRFARAWREGSA